MEALIVTHALLPARYGAVPAHLVLRVLVRLHWVQVGGLEWHQDEDVGPQPHAQHPWCVLLLQRVRTCALCAVWQAVGLVHCGVVCVLRCPCCWRGARCARETWLLGWVFAPMLHGACLHHCFRPAVRLTLHDCCMIAACSRHAWGIHFVLVARRLLLCHRQIFSRRTLRGAQLQGGGGSSTRLAAGCVSPTNVGRPCPRPSALCSFPSLHCLLAIETTGNGGLEPVSIRWLLCSGLLPVSRQTRRAA